MLVPTQVAEQVEQLLRIGLAQLCHRQEITSGVIRAVDAIGDKPAEAGLLVKFGVSTRLLNKPNILVIGDAIHLGVSHKVLK